MFNQIKRFYRWFVSPTKKEILCDDSNLYDKLTELENRIIKLEEENIETSNVLYELMNSIDAIDTRIDIVTLENWTKKNV